MYLRLSVACLATLAAACGAPAEQEVPPAPTIHKSMTSTIEPGSQLIQNAGFDLYNENGDLDATVLGDDRWKEVADAAREIELVAVAMADAEELEVADPGTTLMNENTDGGTSTAEVRALIDDDPEGIATEFRALAAAAQGVNLAAQSQDAQAFDEAIVGFTDTCTSCHNKFWYEDAPASAGPQD